MIKIGIIKPLSGSVELLNFQVIIEKTNGSLRICLDSRNLNKSIKRKIFPLSTAKEIFADMHGAKYSTKIDSSNSFWQIPVDKDN